MKTHFVQQETKVTSPSSITTSTAANLDPDLQNLSVVASGLLNNQYYLMLLLIFLPFFLLFKSVLHYFDFLQELLPVFIWLFNMDSYVLVIKLF
jgi:hypothetical protein